MWYLLAAIIGWSSLIIILKLFEVKKVNMYVGITLNYFVGAVFAFLFAPLRLSAAEIVQAPWFATAMVVGVVFMLTFVVYGFSAQKSGVAVTTIAGRSAMVIPVVYAFLGLGERPTALKVAMLVLIVAAMWMILRKGGGKDTAAKHAWWVLLLPVAVFLFNGTSDTMVQYAQKVTLSGYANSLGLPPERFIPVFMGTMFLASTATGVVCYLLNSIRHPHVPNGRDIAWGSLLGFLNWVCMIGVFNGLNRLDGSIFYPLYYTGTILVSTAVGVWFFRERLSPLNYAGVVIAVVAIAVLSMQ